MQPLCSSNFRLLCFFLGGATNRAITNVMDIILRQFRSLLPIQWDAWVDHDWLGVPDPSCHRGTTAAVAAVLKLLVWWRSGCCSHVHRDVPGHGVGGASPGRVCGGDVGGLWRSSWWGCHRPWHVVQLCMGKNGKGKLNRLDFGKDCKNSRLGNEKEYVRPIEKRRRLSPLSAH